jgi:hypothetical protein
VNCPCGKAAFATRLELARHIASVHGASSVKAMGLALQIENGTELSEADRALFSDQPPAPAPIAPPPSLPTSTPEDPPMAFKPKPCPDCAKPFTPTGPAQKRCPSCASAKHAKRGNRPRPERTGERACSYCHRPDGSHSPKCKRSGPRKPPGRPRTPSPGGADGVASCSPIVAVLDQEIAKLERQLAALKDAREILA